MPLQPDRGSAFGFVGFALTRVSFGIPWLARCLSTIGRLQPCGEVWIGSSNYSASQSLTAWRASLGSVPAIATAIRAAIILSMTHLDSSPHLPNVLLHFRPYAGMLSRSLSRSPLLSHSAVLSGQ